MRRVFFPLLVKALLPATVGALLSCSVVAESSLLVEPDLVDIRDVIPDIVLDIRYGFRLLQSALTYIEPDHHG